MTAVLFVCTRNGGKSQMAAGLMRAAAPQVAVDSASADPGTELHAQSVASLPASGPTSPPAPRSRSPRHFSPPPTWW